MRIQGRREFTGIDCVNEAMAFVNKIKLHGAEEIEPVVSGGWALGETPYVVTLHGAKTHVPLTRRTSVTINGCHRGLRFYALASSMLVVTYVLDAEVMP